MLAVIELAQLLSGALDDNFHINNKPAVLEVVSCLEKFNITYDSYREVQNTRIIKDLQALRQNKGNDQALAKRIKNLLRKWKEHLASSAPPAATAGSVMSSQSQSSQPNSPQNMSQGSSDTQFMTHQSQSPPISQLRMVNGPTSFTNLLPKSQQQARPITSPAITQLPLQNGHHHEAPPKLLGKRKAEMDENDNNQNRRKVLKREPPSPIKPNNSFIHNNVASPMMVPIVPVVQPTPPPPPLQPQQPTPQPLKEPPKKRGRKKGSKGIDSMLNGAVPDFQAEFRQKIALSAGKRNKTTVELQQMLESNQNSAMGWTNGDIDHNMVDRGLAASQHNHQSLTSQSSSRFKDKVSERINNIKQEREESSNEAKKLRVKNEAAAAISSAEEEIARIRALLPPIDYEAAARDETFEKYNNTDEYGDSVVCTCVQREVISYLGDEDDATVNDVKPPALLSHHSLHNEDDEGGVKNGKNGKVVVADESDDDETDDFCAVDEVDDVLLKSPPPIPAAMKSIFDPEYDANENLIEEMVQRKRSNTTKVIEVKVDKEAIKSNRVQSIADTAAVVFPQSAENNQNDQDNSERVPITNYVFDEDPMCPARAFFLKDQVPHRKVELFHRSYVPGVNGHWNGIETEPSLPDYAPDNEHIDYTKHQLWKRVVPRYDFLTCDRIPKTTFNDGSPFSIPPPPPPPSSEDVTKDEAAAAGVKQEPCDGLAKKESNNSDIEFREWHECMNVRSYNDEVLTILPYVIID